MCEYLFGHQPQRGIQSIYLSSDQYANVGHKLHVFRNCTISSREPRLAGGSYFALRLYKENKKPRLVQKFCSKLKHIIYKN